MGGALHGEGVLQVSSFLFRDLFLVGLAAQVFLLASYHGQPLQLVSTHIPQRPTV